MHIYAFIPLIATIAYVPLLVTTASVRPWKRQHKLFMLFLISAALWSLTDFIFRGNFVPSINTTLIPIIVMMFFLMGIQIHSFISSFFPPHKKRWLIFAYTTLIINIVLTAIGWIPNDIGEINGILYPDYGYSIITLALPLVILLVRDVYVLLPKLKNHDNPIIYNQTTSLLLCLAVLAVFVGSAMFPFGREFPISHLGNMLNAFILYYAVVGQQLVDIRSVLRQGMIWGCTLIIGVAVFWFIIFIFHYLFQLDISIGPLMVITVAAILTALFIFKLKDVFTRFMSKAIQGDSYQHRQKLLSFANKIHNLFSLNEQGAELLALIRQAVNCSKTGLLFLDANGDYETQFVEAAHTDENLKNLKLRGDNPLVEFLKRERTPLTRESIAIQPEFLGLWQQEKDILESSGIELFVPLISREHLIGILVLDKKKGGRYTLEDYNLLADVTGRVAVSMEKEYLREQLHERERELSVINRSNAIITSSLDIQRIYDNFIHELKRVVDVDWAAIAVIEELEVYLMALSTEIGSPWKVGERLPLKGSGTEWVVTHGKPIADNDLQQESRFSTDQYLFQHGVRSVAYLPLMISSQIIGTLIVASRNPNTYNPRQIRLLEQLSTQIAMPIENARLYARTERLARIDSLTGLLNRRSLDETLPGEIGRHSRYGGVFSLVIIDLDSLKTVNDSYGHIAGDELLRQIGNIIKNTIRESDRAFRYGGDEFAILLPHTPINAAFKVSERIRQQTFAKIEIGSIPITISLGLASWPGDGVSPNELIAAADSALYKAKRSGRNRSVCSSGGSASAETVQVKVFDGPESSSLSTIYALAATVDSRDRYSKNHSKQVHDCAVAIGEELGMNQLEINHLGTCALLHDIGKIGISDELLNKKDSLSDEEWETIRSHSRLGAAIVGHSSQLLPCVQGILHHHEKFDGTGYPDRLKGQLIPLESRILAIADSFAAMTSRRPYSRPLKQDEAVEEIKKGAGTQFDPELVEVFIRIIPRVFELIEQSR